MKKTIILICLITLISCSSKKTLEIIGSAEAVSTEDIYGGSPSEFYIKVQRAWLLPNADCMPEAGKTLSDYIVQNRNSFEEKNINQNPTLFEGNPEAGTYNCLIIELKDTMKFRPNEEASEIHANCQMENHYYFDVFHENLEEENTWYNPIEDRQNLATGNQKANRERYEGNNQTIYTYATTDLNELTDLGFGQGILLTEEITIEEGSVQQLTFAIDTKDKVTSYEDTCSVEAPTMTIN